MSAATICLPVERGPEKPAFRSPCNGCGFCCAAEPCEVAQQFLGADSGPCPALEFEAGRFWCGMARHPSSYIDLPEFADQIIGLMFAALLGVGRGCDAETDSEVEARERPAAA